MTSKINASDIDNVKLTFGNVAKIVGAIAFLISIAGSYFNLLHRQEAFEKTQDILHQAIIEQLTELKSDAKDTKIVIQQMNLTLNRTNTILEQMDKK